LNFGPRQQNEQTNVRELGVTLGEKLVETESQLLVDFRVVSVGHSDAKQSFQVAADDIVSCHLLVLQSLNTLVGLFERFYSFDVQKTEETICHFSVSELVAILTLS
jgi:hypothetical protein